MMYFPEASPDNIKLHVHATSGIMLKGVNIPVHCKAGPLFAGKKKHMCKVNLQTKM